MSGPGPGCFIHIGAPKTGSTAIQNFCAGHREVLFDRGLLYPDISLRGDGHHDLAFLLSGGYPEWATRPEPLPTLDDLATQLAQLAGEHRGAILISSEDLYLFPAPEKLRRFLDRSGILATHPVSIIAYLRRQDEAHESWYNQTIKAQGEIHDIDACIARWWDLWDYDRQLEPWARCFGKSALHVRPYEVAGAGDGTLLDDFFRLLGVDTSGLQFAKGRINTGLNRDLLEFQRLVNRLPLEAVEKRRFHKQLIDLGVRTSGTGLFDESKLLSPDRRTEILDAYRASNRAVAQNYLDGRALFGEETVEDAPHPAEGTGLNLEKLTYILGWIMTRTGAR